MSEYKPLVIEVKSSSTPQGVAGKWSDITSQMPTFTRDIITPSIKEGADISAIVSGIPTIFARANLFRLSINYVENKKADSDHENSLMQFYESLVDEWHGLIACIALDYQKISIRRISLGYSDGKEINLTSNIYEPKGAFGNMLFERRPLWCEQGKNENEQNIPFIDVISFDGKVVGAVSPDSLFFTAVEYSIDESLPFVDIKSRRFTDPLKSTLSETQINQLNKYVEHILNRLDSFKSTFDDLQTDIRPDYTTISKNLSSWEALIDTYIKEHKYKAEGSVPPVDCFKTPFNKLFNYSSELFGLEGTIYENEIANAIAFNPRTLLLPRGTQIARFIFDNRLSRDADEMKKLPVTILRASIKNSNEYAYFALPLSAKGLNVFGGNVEALVGQDRVNVITSSLRATYDVDKDVDNLAVSLILRTDSNREMPFNVVYTAKDTPIKNKDIMMWPNFISKQWNTYYLFSEMPHNVPTSYCPYCATPFLGNTEDPYFRALTDDKGDPLYVVRDGKIVVGNKANVELVVTSDSKVAANPYKYEIYKSNVPFRGACLTVTGKECGFILFRYSAPNDSSTLLPRNYLSSNKTFAEANVGIDFGSTNTSVAFFNKTENTDPQGLELKNHTVSLLSYVDPDKKVNFHVATEKDILFFPNKCLMSNSVKSILTLHDKLRIVQTNDENDQIASLQKEVKGGFPCFEKNLPVGTVEEKRINLNFNLSGQNIGAVSLVHNMKWSESIEDKANKEAFLRTLLLQVYADLFEKNALPVKIKWSYPSSMGNQLLLQYRMIWDDLTKVHPVNVPNDLEISQPPTVNVTFEGNNPFGQNELKGDSPFGGENPFGSDSPFANTDPFASTQTVAQSVDENDPFKQDDNPFGSNDPFSSIDTDNSFKVPSSQTKARVNLKPDNGPIDFEFAPVNQQISMTEASAVATYMMAKSLGPSTPNMLTLCFDIGGSTTDISALCKMNAPQGILTAMIKQNSIRFAAQRVSQATKFSKGFKDVLLNTCSNNQLFIDGLNRGADKYSPSTASYYFEQIVDELGTLGQDKMQQFYKLIASGCKELMSVNLYVTGLIMYYAGQLTRKIIEEVRRSKQHTVENWEPLVNIAFAGKGARIFEWFWSTNANSANQYYIYQFVNGLGGKDVIAKYLANWPKLNVGTRAWDEVKYEVSKGLSIEQMDVQHQLLVPKNDDAIEVLGEEGFCIIDGDGKKVPLMFDNSITREMMENIGTYFQAPAADGMIHCNRFKGFIATFIQAAKGYFGQDFDIEIINQGFRDMDMNSYISNLPDFRNASSTLTKDKNGKFDFVAPIIILEGMKFYDQYLMKCLK